MTTMLDKAVWAAGDIAATMTEDVRHVLSNAAIERIARAVLMAVREPSEGLTYKAGWFSRDYSVEFTAMIDAILNEDSAK